MRVFSRFILMFIRIKEFFKWSSTLENGVYCVDSKFKCFAKNSKNSLEFAQSLKCNPKIKLFKFSFHNAKSTDKGTLLLLSNGCDGNMVPLSVKVFDFNALKVTTYYNDSQKYLADSMLDENFKSFNMPQRYSNDSSKMIIVDELIDSVPVKEWDANSRVAIFKNVINDYLKYFKLKHKVFSKNSFDFDNSLIKQCFEKITIDFDSLPKFVQHGDLTFNNILLNKKNQEIYYIDFEHHQSYMFLYDLFWLIQNDYIYNNNSTLLDAYFNGTFDKDLSDLFVCVNVDYNMAMRHEYFYCFLLEMYENRVKDLDEANKQISLRSMQKIFDYIQQYEGKYYEP